MKEEADEKGNLPQGFDYEKFTADKTPEAEKAARWFFIRDNVVKNNNISVTDEDLDAFYEKRALEFGQGITAEFVDTESAPLAPSPTQIIPTAITPTELQATAGEVVASKSGSKYHLPTCAGAKQIKPENLISFASASAAEAAGYTPAANCKGLQ